MRRPILAAACAAAAFAVLHAQTAAAQRFQVTGPSECLNCHDHEAERTWYEKQEAPEVRKLFPDKGASAGHANSLKQLETPKSNDFAKAIGLKDKYDLKGSCVQCHGTVFSGDANAGVSCESCHGPASGYLKPHQTKGTYDQSVAQFGMTKLVGNVAGWAQQCATCHVMTDKRLVDAGHPSGDDFDLGKKYGPVSLHFKKKYNAAEVSAIGRPLVDALVRKRTGGAAAAAAAPTPAAAPAPAVAPLPPPSAPARAPAPAPTPAPAVPAAPSAAPIAPPVARPSSSPQPTAPSSQPRLRVSPAPVSAPPAPAVAASAARATAVPSAPAPVPAAAAPLPEPLPAPAAAPAPPAGVSSLPAGVALVQGKLITALTQLLRDGASAPLHTSTPAPPLTPYSGPDAALIELQRDAIALALETLGRAPAPPAAR